MGRAKGSSINCAKGIDVVLTTAAAYIITMSTCTSESSSALSLSLSREHAEIPSEPPALAIPDRIKVDMDIIK
jgi:hypothetical protein